MRFFVKYLRIVCAYSLLELKAFFRNTSSIVFTLLLPVLFFILWASLHQGNPVEETARLLTPAILAWVILGNAVTQQAIQIPILREAGVLKRLKGTPLSSGIFFTARICVLLCLVLFQSAVILTLSAWLLKPLSLPWLTLFGVIFLGSTCFASLGLALANIIPNGPAAPAIANIVFFPMLLLSNSFFSLQKAPWIIRILGVINPATYLLELLRNVYANNGWGLIHFYGWGILAAWFLLSLYGAIFRFRWESKR